MVRVLHALFAYLCKLYTPADVVQRSLHTYNVCKSLAHAGQQDAMGVSWDNLDNKGNLIATNTQLRLQTFMVALPRLKNKEL